MEISTLMMMRRSNLDGSSGVYNYLPINPLENCRNPVNDPNPRSSQLHPWEGLEPGRKLKQDCDDSSLWVEMKDPSQRVKTDDIDSFFGGLPLAGCPLGAPTLHNPEL